MDSHDGSLFRSGRVSLRLFLGHFAQSGMKESLPVEHPCVQTKAANTCTSLAAHA